MKRASAIVTNRGGRTCHAAIIARELGVPAVVGSGNATQVIEDGQLVTVSCAEGDTGFIYEGKLGFERATTDLGNMPPAPLKIMMNVANPERAFDFGQLPNAGIGLARLEMIIASHIGVHPNALLEYDRQDAATKKINIADYEHAVRLWTIVLEVSVMMAQFPSRQIAELSYEYRTLGLGYANIGGLLMSSGIPYDSAEGRAIAGALTAIMTGVSYATSAEMAGELGPFPGFAPNRENMLRVIRNHRRAALGQLEGYEGLSVNPT